MSAANVPETATLEEPSLRTLLQPLRRGLIPIVAASLAAGVVALGVTYFVAPTYTARTSFLPPQQQNSAAAAIASLGAIASLAGNAAGIKSSGDQYVSLMQSDKVADRLIDEFKLMDVYKAQFRVDARDTLSARSRIESGKRDGIITVEFDDADPKRAAAIANRYVEELRRMASEMALTEAQQRRSFFETELKRTRDQLAAAQRNLESSGFGVGALRAEPKAASEIYARLRADLTAAEMRLQLLRGTLAEHTPEVRQQQTVVSALRTQLASAERTADNEKGSPDYIGRYREFKYQETLFELVSRQFELARLDEAREGATIQVVDVATPPERRSKPKRTNIAIVTTLASFLVLAFIVTMRGAWRRMPDPVALPRQTTA